MRDAILGRLSAGESLSEEEMTEVIDSIMQGEWEESHIGLLLTLLNAKGETVEEVAGAAFALRKHMLPISSEHAGLLDTCGTGGDGSRTFNISTAAAIVTAAAGVPVAKHGNRKITSKTGSADVLMELGVNVEANLETVQSCLSELGLCFCFAPLMHPAMKQVATVRRQLGIPTLFNILGPLTNPAGASYQLLGVGKPHLRTLMAESLQLLGTQHAMVVCGKDGLDEVTLADETLVAEVTPAGVQHTTLRPEDFGIATAPLDALVVDGPAESAATIRRILAGEQGTARDIVVLNAAAGLLAANAASSPPEAAEKVAAAIDSGAAQNLLDALCEKSHG